jgi:hypothetical protein
MYARIIRAHVLPENFDQALAAARDYNLPMVTQMPGFRSGYWTGDRQTGTITTFVVFDSQDGIRAAEAGMERMRPLVAPLRVQFDSVENLEVFAAQALLATAGKSARGPLEPTKDPPPICPVRDTRGRAALRSGAACGETLSGRCLLKSPAPKRGTPALREEGLAYTVPARGMYVAKPDGSGR